jgi:carbonic anhydrase/acetyltransferase-like protein (isoleucine patch superfamily)
MALRSFNGKSPRVAPTAWVSEAAYVVGDVEIGEHASVWPGVVLRADEVRISLGAYVNVQDGSVLHSWGAPLVIEDGVSIGHGVVVHGVFVGAGSLLGNNSTVLEGAHVGRGCLLAANAVVRARAQVPDGSFVTGVPGEVKGPVSAAQREMLRDTARSVDAQAQRFKQEGL